MVVMSLFDSPLTEGSAYPEVVGDTRFTTAVAAAARRREDEAGDADDSTT